MTEQKKKRPSGLTYKKDNAFMNDAFKLYGIWVQAGRPKQTRFSTLLHKEHGYEKAKNLTGLLNRFKAIEEMK
ncbi:hypothetical protein KGV31_002145 [Vibrio parahaemolyticus]|nr:hypothetical protein [Vibrio parahaemolyticus]EHU0344289.1 hypothetical protein [Vibrio parahaemolyticus]EHU0354323.1 hypothetical protein [Vibrio parahaemolyticus]